MDAEQLRKISEAQKGKRLAFERDGDGKVVFRAVAKEQDEPLEVECSFCAKKRSQVAKLIAGPTAYICNECVMLCVTILREDGLV